MDLYLLHLFCFFYLQILDPYLNYSIVSEPENYGSHKDGTFQPNCSMIVEPMNEDYENNHPSLQQRIIGLSSTTNPCLPTEFDMRPDVTPTGDEPNTISFETPMVRSSPSQLPTSIHQQQQKSSEEETTTNDSDETLEQVSEIVDQTPSTYQQPYMITATGGNKHMKHFNKNDDESKNNNIIINNQRSLTLIRPSPQLLSSSSSSADDTYILMNKNFFPF